MKTNPLFPALAALLLLLSVPVASALSVDLAPLCVDRAAIERVYHEHRTGTKPPFAEAMPPALLEKLVRADAQKEAVLARTYGVPITAAMVAAEVNRINTTTRAPEILAEIKAALGNDDERFARSMARPFIVERLLHDKFQNDDTLHAPQRREAEQARERLLAKLTMPDTHEVTWQLTPRPTEETPAAPSGPVSGSGKSANYSVEATVQIAQVLSAPAASGHAEKKLYFEDLEPQLQNVLRAQLRQPGDVSAVIELPSGFLVFQAKEKTDATLAATSITIPKRSYEAWLAQQPEL